MTVFDRRSKLLQREWAAKLENSKDYDYLRDEVAKRLAERLDVCTNPAITFRKIDPACLF